jgi:hypothetical protein
MLQQRRYVIREKSQLKFCYEAILYHAQDILAKRKCEYWMGAVMFNSVAMVYLLHSCVYH